MTQLKGVFWDVDGTLADTEMHVHRKAFNKAFSYFGLKWYWGEDLYEKLLDIAGGLNRIAFYIKQKNIDIDKNKIKAIHSKKQLFYQQILKEEIIPLRPGVGRLIKELAEHNISQWIVTTSGRKAIDALFVSSLAKYLYCFKGSITYEDVLNHKPKPDAYLKALSMSKLSKNECIVIEDSEIGLMSAKAANLKCIITISPWKKVDRTNFESADCVVNNLGESFSNSKFIIGPASKEGFINFSYLQKIIS